MRLFALLLLAPSFALAGSAQVKGQAKWVSEAPVEKILGTGDITGTLSVDLANLATMTGNLEVPVASMQSGNDKRDRHLKGPDWLDAGKHPTITFVIKSVTVNKQEKTPKYEVAELTVTGDFTLHGVSTPLSAPATLKWKGNKMKISTKFQVKLADYKIAGREGVVGSKVGTNIDIEAALKGVVK